MMERGNNFVMKNSSGNSFSPLPPTSRQTDSFTVHKDTMLENLNTIKAGKLANEIDTRVK